MQKYSLTYYNSEKWKQANIWKLGKGLVNNRISICKLSSTKNIAVKMATCKMLKS
jgi:hypothetical protein